MKTQLEMWHDAEQRHFAVCRTFNDIQCGPNPLTPDEVRRLIDRRPERYSFLEAWATPRAEA